MDTASPGTAVTGSPQTPPPQTPQTGTAKPQQTTFPSAETTPPPSPSPSATTSAASPAPSDDPVILTISGSGVSAETTWTLGQLQALTDGYREYTYSTTNNWPAFGHMTAHGVSLQYLLKQAGMQSGASSFKFTSTDGYYAIVTYDQIFGRRYSYADHSANGSGGASEVVPVIAWEWGDDTQANPENIRPFFGQSGPMEVNSASFVKDLCKIEVSTASAGTWAVPGCTIADGSVVPIGTQLELTHDSMDSIRIYYTLDGSEPDYSSPVYNRSTSYFQPQLIQPLTLTGSVTVKAFAAGFGKDRSPVVTINITVG